MKKKFGYGSLVAMWIFGLALGVLCCSLFFVSKYGGIEAFPYTTKFAAIYNMLDERYVGELDMEQACDNAYSIMVASTEDRWSRYMTAEEYADYKLFQQNSYKGIGITVLNSADEESYPQVAALVEDSPAQSAGVKIDDYIMAIDGVELKGMAAAEIKELIAQRIDTEFSLTVLRGEQELSLKITAGTVLSKPVEYEMLDNNIGYIRIKNFEQRSGEETVKAVDELSAKGAEALVFDVRYNPGGQLSELMTALDHLLPEGDMFVSANEAGEEKVTISDPEFVDLPLAVLIDENSYSAAEFFAAALSEYDRAVLVGAPTTGKSRAQVNFGLSDGSAVHLSINRYLTPKRVDLTEAGGLKPKLEVKLSEELLPYLIAGELPHEQDEPLQAAVKVLTEK